MRLGKLLEAIKTQLTYEYHDPDEQEYRLKNMTVYELLQMLEYMDPDDEQD